jgi:hypothetical protein
MTKNRRQSGGRYRRGTQNGGAPAVSVTDLGGGRGARDTHAVAAPAFYIPGRGEGHDTRDTRCTCAFHRVQRLRRRACMILTPTVCLPGGLNDTGMGMAVIVLKPWRLMPSHPHKPGGPGATVVVTPTSPLPPSATF